MRTGLHGTVRRRVAPTTLRWKAAIEVFQNATRNAGSQPRSHPGRRNVLNQESACKLQKLSAVVAIDSHVHNTLDHLLYKSLTTQAHTVGPMRQAREACILALLR